MTPLWGEVGNIRYVRGWKFFITADTIERLDG
jgi:hypothetical protein